MISWEHAIIALDVNIWGSHYDITTSPRSFYLNNTYRIVVVSLLWLHVLMNTLGLNINIMFMPKCIYCLLYSLI